MIYAEEDEKEIRKYSDRLERYYSAMSAMLPSKKIKPSPSNRVTIYVVRSERIVRKLYGSGADSRYVGASTCRARAVLSPSFLRSTSAVARRPSRSSC